MAHSPQFDRSVHEAPLEQPEVYDIDRAAEEFKHDSAALMQLVMSLHHVARSLFVK